MRLLFLIFSALMTSMVIPASAFAAETSYELMLLHMFIYICLIIFTIVLPFGYRRKGFLLFMYISCLVAIGFVFEEFKLSCNEVVMLVIPMLLWAFLVFVILKLKKHKIMEDNIAPCTDDDTTLGP